MKKNSNTFSLGALINRWKQLFLNPGSDPTKPLTRAYILALSLIAVLTVGGHFVTALVNEEQRKSTEIAFQIGRQRTLMEQISLYAHNYYRLNEGLDYDLMMQFTWEIENGHKKLLAFIDRPILLKGYESKALYNVYHAQPFNLDSQMKDFISTVREYAQYTADSRAAMVDFDENRDKLLEELTYKSDKKVRFALDAALEKYQSETLEKFARLYTFQLSAALFILIVLFAEALFIFRPLITKIKEYHLALQRLALEDSLTGLNNRRAYMKGAETELKRAQRDKTPVTVALIDLDHFKKVNDTYGHEVGDRVLKHFSGILKRSFRAGDITGRIGGEEFAILLPNIDREGAMTILQRLCDQTARTPCEYEDQEGNKQYLHYTLSVGFTGPSLVTGQDIDNLLSKADLALYEAKAQGRNRVVCDNP